jgi:hypothetical protein
MGERVGGERQAEGELPCDAFDAAGAQNIEFRQQIGMTAREQEIASRIARAIPRASVVASW